jgi:hypothetical protein
VVVCSDNRRYSWQVAPQQSPLPLLTDVAKLVETKNVKRGQCTKMSKKYSGKCKEKKNQKKKETGMGYRP